MSSSSQVAESWISAFCSLIGHEYFAEVSEDFIEDDFNLTGLQSQVPMYKEALEMILDVEPEDDDDDDISDEDDEDQSDLGSDPSMRDHNGNYGRGGAKRHARMQSDISVIEGSAEMLYGLIHQRFITSRQGIQQMLEKYEMGHFGTCPRVYCRGAKVLPVGCSDIPNQETVKLFCPSCLDVYAPPNSRFQGVDGAFFGTTFGCLFFMTFPELSLGGTGRSPVIDTHSNGSDASLLDGKPSSSPLSPEVSAPTPSHQVQAEDPKQSININGVASHNLAPGLGYGNIYEPKIYGFRVSELAKTGPRMKWLRQKPANLADLDEVAIWEASRPDYEGEDKYDDPEEADGEEDMDEDVEAQDEENEEDGVVDQVLDEAGRGKKSRHRGNSHGGGGTAVR
ncbi:hypothetical protein MBLNU457_5683t1 [Dothideomycetes sp. NU457]